MYEWSVLPTILLCPHCPLHIIVPTVPNVLLYSTSTSLSSDSDFPSYILTYFPSPHCICHGPHSHHCPHCTVIVLAVLRPLHCHLVSCTVLSNVLLTFVFTILFVSVSVTSLLVVLLLLVIHDAERVCEIMLRLVLLLSTDTSMQYH